MNNINKRVDILEQELKKLKEVLDKMIYREKILERNKWTKIGSLIYPQAGRQENKS